MQIADPTIIKDTLATLDALVSSCQQAEQGFRSCADQAHADDIRALLRRRAEECKASASELQAHAKRLDGGARPSSAQPAAQQRSWAVSRTTLASHTDHALLEICEREEDAALELYTEALARPLEPAAKVAIETQRLETKRHHEQLRAMRDRIRGLE